MSEAAAEPDAQALVLGGLRRRDAGRVRDDRRRGRSPDYIAQFLWKLLIDESHQRRGFGTATLDLVVEYFRSRGVHTMWTSAGQGEGSPVTFYERYGFERTGELHGDEIMLRLEIA